MTPAAYSSRSVRLVLPASTCARIPRFRVREVVRTECHVLQVDGDSFRVGHELSAHRSAPWSQRAASASLAHRTSGGEGISARPLAMAVVDVAGEVIVHRRDAGGMPMTSRIAVAKVRTALFALRSSGAIKLPGGIVEGIRHLYGGDLDPWAGGVLVTDGDAGLGAAGAVTPGTLFVTRPATVRP
ncbi:heme-binding protein [Streptomyces sp. NPDC054783]